MEVILVRNLDAHVCRKLPSDRDHRYVCNAIPIDVVLTARRCVSKPLYNVTYPAQAEQIATNFLPSLLAILVGDDVESATVAAHGQEVVFPMTGELCDHDIAAIILDTDILGVAPLKVSTKTQPEIAHSVRTIGFGHDGDASAGGTKLLRERVKITDLSPTEFEVGEATCDGDTGGPALDESNGELLGVVSRSGSLCEGPDVHNVYTRADAYMPLITAALPEGLTLLGGHLERGARVGRMDEAAVGLLAARKNTRLGGSLEHGQMTDGLRHFP